MYIGSQNTRHTGISNIVYSSKCLQSVLCLYLVPMICWRPSHVIGRRYLEGIRARPVIGRRGLNHSRSVLSLASGVS